MSIKNYTVITGPSSGIGLATAKAFAKPGKNLKLVARREAHLLELQKELLTMHPSLMIHVARCDLTELPAVY